MRYDLAQPSRVCHLQDGQVRRPQVGRGRFRGQAPPLLFGRQEAPEEDCRPDDQQVDGPQGDHRGLGHLQVLLMVRIVAKLNCFRTLLNRIMEYRFPSLFAVVMLLSMNSKLTLLS